MQPEDARVSGSALAAGYDGVLASGGFLKSKSRRRVLEWYRGLLAESDRPFLGVCLGMKILGFCYGARMRKTAPEVGFREIAFQRDFPLAPGLTSLRAYENHRFELLPPLPAPLRKYANGAASVEAVKVDGRSQFAVQFHPEVGGTSVVILDRFLNLCGSG